MNHYRLFTILVYTTHYQGIGTLNSLCKHTYRYDTLKIIHQKRVLLFAKKVHYHLIPQLIQSTAQSLTNYIIVEQQGCFFLFSPPHSVSVQLTRPPSQKVIKKENILINTAFTHTQHNNNIIIYLLTDENFYASKSTYNMYIPTYLPMYYKYSICKSWWQISKQCTYLCI